MSVRDKPAAEDLSAWMRGYQGGDIAAFEGLYARLAPVLRRYLLSLARDLAWADDLVQETFLQIHRARHTYDPSQPVQPWAVAIAHHVFLMSRRTRSRKHDFDRVTLEDIDPAAPGGHERPFMARDQLHRGLSTLTPKTRHALWLHHVLGWPFAEVGKRLGMTEATARLRASRGMRALRRTIDETERQDGE